MPVYTGPNPVGCAGSLTTSNTVPLPAVAALYLAGAASSTSATAFPARTARRASPSVGSSITVTGFLPAALHFGSCALIRSA